MSATPEAPKGKMLVFLSNGTLVQDSCWETYRLSKWRRDGENRMVWEEDGVEIPAEILSLNDSDLRLRLTLVSSTVEASYTAAEAPYLCPDMPQ
jgi:hypothetical protein